MGAIGARAPRLNGLPRSFLAKNVFWRALRKRECANEQKPAGFLEASCINRRLDQPMVQPRQLRREALAIGAVVFGTKRLDATSMCALPSYAASLRAASLTADRESMKVVGTGSTAES